MGEVSETEALGVQELNKQVGHSVDSSESLQSVQCRGTVADVNPSQKGTFFTLVDGEYKIRCVAWKSDQMDLDLAAGMEVVLTGNIDYWTREGRLKFKVFDGTAVGDGDHTTATDELKTELGARGWFDDTHKSTLPRVPETIGVVTSHHGDARHDISTAIHDSSPAVDVIVQNASVQGSQAPHSLAEGIQSLDQDDAIDVMIVGRGGGSSTALQAFNTEQVAEAMHDADTPIMSAVGHTDDRLIADRVADAAATTPREAGKEVVSGRGAVWGQLSRLEDDLDDAYDSVQREQDHKQEVEHAASRARAKSGRRTRVYKAAIGVLLLVIIVLGLMVLL